MPKKNHNIEIDDDLWRKARATALIEQKLFKDWLAEAIKEKLARKKEGER